MGLLRISTEDKTNFVKFVNILNFYCNFAKYNMVLVAQLVRASGCGPEGRGFESHHAPEIQKLS